MEEYFTCPPGRDLRDAIEAFQAFQLENPDWFEQECVDINAEEEVFAVTEYDALLEKPVAPVLEFVPEYRNGPPVLEFVPEYRKGPPVLEFVPEYRKEPPVLEFVPEYRKGPPVLECVPEYRKGPPISNYDVEINENSLGVQVSTPEVKLEGKVISGEWNDTTNRLVPRLKGFGTTEEMSV